MNKTISTTTTDAAERIRSRASEFLNHHHGQRVKHAHGLLEDSVSALLGTGATNYAADVAEVLARFEAQNFFPKDDPNGAVEAAERDLIGDARAVILQAKRAAVFLKPPHATDADRAAALASAASLMRQAVEQLVRAGRDPLALAALDIALEAEHG